MSASWITTKLYIVFQVKPLRDHRLTKKTWLNRLVPLHLKIPCISPVIWALDILVSGHPFDHSNCKKPHISHLGQCSIFWEKFLKMSISVEYFYRKHFPRTLLKLIMPYYYPMPISCFPFSLFICKKDACWLPLLCTYIYIEGLVSVFKQHWRNILVLLMNATFAGLD